jgi:NDP-sugar pyrophosphorylase family protein
MIVIPMVGSSSRFFQAGYKVPKYMLHLGGITVFEHVLMSFSNYFRSEKFLFIVRHEFHTMDFIHDKCFSYGIESYNIVEINGVTRGQAETVSIGLSLTSHSLEEPITIFNIDTIRKNFKFPDFIYDDTVDGYLEVFLGDGDNWSFVEPDPNKSYGVLRTAEKSPISNLCCTGLYFFKNSILIFKLTKGQSAQQGNGY